MAPIIPNTFTYVLNQYTLENMKNACMPDNPTSEQIFEFLKHIHSVFPWRKNNKMSVMESMLSRRGVALQDIDYSLLYASNGGYRESAVNISVRRDYCSSYKHLMVLNDVVKKLFFSEDLCVTTVIQSVICSKFGLGSIDDLKTLLSTKAFTLGVLDVHKRQFFKGGLSVLQECANLFSCKGKRFYNAIQVDTECLEQFTDALIDGVNTCLRRLVQKATEADMDVTLECIEYVRYTYTSHLLPQLQFIKETINVVHKDIHYIHFDDTFIHPHQKSD